MKSLQKTFQTNADKMGTHQFTLIKRTSTVAMYRRDWLDGKLHSYEVFKVKTVKAGAPLPGGSFVQEDYESYPGKGGFGRYGYSCKTLERANHWFEHLSHLNDNSNTSDNGEPLDDSNSIKSERSSEIGAKRRGRKAVDRSTLKMPKKGEKFDIKTLSAMNPSVSSGFMYIHLQGLIKMNQAAAVDTIKGGRGKPTVIYEMLTD
jgi:hypothetical protein